MRWLAYLHPLAMLLVLALGLVVAREGLELRKHRLRRVRYDRSRHLRLARWFVALVALGYLSGLASLGWLRGAELLDSAHAALTSSALACFALAAYLGRRLQRRAPGWLRAVHLAAGALGLLLSLAAAFAGWAILP